MLLFNNLFFSFLCAPGRLVQRVKRSRLHSRVAVWRDRPQFLFHAFRHLQAFDEVADALGCDSRIGASERLECLVRVDWIEMTM